VSTQHATSTKRTRLVNATAAGTSNIVSGVLLDMQGFDGAEFVCALGTLTAGQQTGIKVQGGQKSDGSDLADLVGAATPLAADADSNKLLVLDVFRTPFRYLKLTVLRGTANAVIDGAFVTQYGAGAGSRKTPESDDATTVSATRVAVWPQYTNTQLTNTTITYPGSTTSINTTYRNAS